MNKQTEFGAFLAKRLENLAARCSGMPDGQRRAMLARARREMVEKSKARNP